MGKRITVVLAVVAAAGLALVSPASAASSGSVTVNDPGVLAANGTVSLTGTYSCAPLSTPGPTFVAVVLKQGTDVVPVNGTDATCDGQVHTYALTDNHYAKLTPGTARAESVVLHLDQSHGIPLPKVLASSTEDITLVNG